MLRVILICGIILIFTGVLYATGHHKQTITCDFVGYFENNRMFGYYLIAINIVTFLLFGFDKMKAKHNWSRISIATLLGVCFVGGSIGGFLGMYTFHHKTQKNYFAIGVPLIIITQIIVLFYWMNFAW